IRRARHYGDEARIEVPLERMDELLEEPVFEELKQESRRLGFLSLTIDPGGFRSGNLNRDLEAGGVAEPGAAVVTLEKPRRRTES
ncbi:MAG: hypothetical protein VX496_06230, partial [Planctomycetota bacterium]|nr:hypothetical protein [Planctomycetota bacterium]